MTDTKINIKFPLEKSPEGAFTTNTSTLDAVESDLKILLLTNYGDRLIHYDFGANLRALLFESGIEGSVMAGTDISSSLIGQRISDQINSAVEKWMPFVTIESMKITSTGNASEVELKIDFSIGTSAEVRTLLLISRA